MLSLLLTLFISLFSICSSNNRLDVQYENNIIHDSHIVEKNAFISTHYSYWGYGDFLNYGNVLASFDSISQMSSLPNGITGSDFANGSVLQITDSSFVNFAKFYTFVGDGSSSYLSSWSMTLFTFVKSSDYKYDIYIRFLNSLNNTTYELFFTNFYTNQTFNGVLQTSWSSNMYFRDVTNNTYLDISSSNLQSVYVMFDLNVWYGYLVLADSTYDSGFRNGYSVGFEDGRMDTQATYDEQVYEEGRQAGYAEGLQYATDTGSTASTIFNGIFDVGLLPVNVFLTIFNFEVFGINIAGIVSALLTLSVVIIIVRFLLGGKQDDK